VAFQIRTEFHYRNKLRSSTIEEEAGDAFRASAHNAFTQCFGILAKEVDKPPAAWTFGEFQPLDFSRREMVVCNPCQILVKYHVIVFLGDPSKKVIHERERAIEGI
jgi:hypothetical protein